MSTSIRRLAVVATVAVRCVSFTPPATLPRCAVSLHGSNPNQFLLRDMQTLNNDYCALRHGQSMANVEKIISSNPHIATTQHGLSPMGREQVQQAGQHVVAYYQANSYDGIVILSSDYRRARETAEYVQTSIQEASLPCSSVILDTRLRERWFGDWDGGSDTNYQNVWQEDAIDPSHTLRNVESVNSVIERTTCCIMEWDAKFQNHLILLVAHGDVLQITQTAFARMDGSLHRSLPHLETATLRPLVLFS
jgi:glucosyl-3-phosphoglycerate phosphatase